MDKIITNTYANIAHKVSKSLRKHNTSPLLSQLQKTPQLEPLNKWREMKKTTKKRSPVHELHKTNEIGSFKSTKVNMSSKQKTNKSSMTDTKEYSVDDLFNNPTVISSIMDNYYKNYVYTGQVTTEKQKILDCLSDAMDH